MSKEFQTRQELWVTASWPDGSLYKRGEYLGRCRIIYKKAKPGNNRGLKIQFDDGQIYGFHNNCVFTSKRGAARHLVKRYQHKLDSYRTQLRAVARLEDPDYDDELQRFCNAIAECEALIQKAQAS